MARNGPQFLIFGLKTAFLAQIGTNKGNNLSNEQTDVLGVFQNQRGGLSRGEIEKLLSNSIPTRTLFRKLQELVEMGLLTTSGVGRGRRYYKVVPPMKTLPNAASNQSAIPLSADANMIQAAVSRPQNQRKPVPYHREFLDQYIPNTTFYLSQTERAHLHETGNRIPIIQTAATYAKQVLQRLLIDLSWNSSRLEGNTYSLLDTEKLLQEGTEALNKSALEAQMILNHKEAIEFLVRYNEDIGFNRYTISNLHALLSNNLLPDPAAPGRLRFQAVGIHQSVYLPTAIPQLIQELFNILIEKAAAINDPFEQSFFIMVHLPYLQPFDDVNKRVSRLAANIPFIRENLAPLSFTDVPDDIYFQGLLGVYEMNRTELLRDVFLWAYERSAANYAVVRQSIGEPDPFRLRYRKLIGEVVTRIVAEKMSKKIAAVFIYTNIKSIPAEDQEQLRQAINTELNSLHEGNIARYQIRPAEFNNWKQQWLP